MDNVTFIEIENREGVETYAIINRGNGEFTSMLKSTYDEMIAAQENQPTIEVTNDQIKRCSRYPRQLGRGGGTVCKW